MSAVPDAYAHEVHDAQLIVGAQWDYLGQELQLLALHEGRIAHAVRDADGHWAHWGDVYTEGGTGDLANVAQIAAAN